MEPYNLEALDSVNAPLDISSVTQVQTQEGIQDWLVNKLAQLLGLNPDDIGISTPLSRYGLDSSSTILLTSDLMDWLGCELEPDVIYQYPTIQTLANHLTERLTLA